MKTIKRLGIWMDHSIAYLMELTDDRLIQHSVLSEFTHEEKEFSLSKNEKLMHNKENHQQSSYYKKLCDSIKNYQEVIVFGPTSAKNELLNLIRADHLFDNIKIEIRDTDKMEENQMHAFVKEYFENLLNQ